MRATGRPQHSQLPINPEVFSRRPTCAGQLTYRLGDRRAATLPLPLLKTDPGSVVPDTEVLMPRGFLDLAFFGFWAIPLWPSVSEYVVFLRVCEETAPLPWPCFCPETEAWRSEVDCKSYSLSASEFGDSDISSLSWSSGSRAGLPVPCTGSPPTLDSFHHIV